MTRHLCNPQARLCAPRQQTSVSLPLSFSAILPLDLVFVLIVVTN